MTFLQRVVGAVTSAFVTICPNKFSLIGINYKRLCEILLDIKEWGQIMLIGILLWHVIVRHGHVKESIMFSLFNKRDHNFEVDEPKDLSKEGFGYGFRKIAFETANMIYQI